MNIQAAQTMLRDELSKLYELSEATNIADWVMEVLTQQTAPQRRLLAEQILTNEQARILASYTQQLLAHKPVQQVLQQAWFYQHRFYVNEHVLIPRPETEELVLMVAQHIQPSSTIIDIGTGSGCIAISLQLAKPHSAITAIDMSADALLVAQKNAIDLGATVKFFQLDFLEENNWRQMPIVDIIVSNPPYIKQAEAATMHANVLSFEPHMALFVPDEDPLLFYRKIAQFGITHLTPEGKIFVEINEALGVATQQLFQAFDYQAVLYKDMQGKDRMIAATKKLT